MKMVTWSLPGVLIGMVTLMLLTVFRTASPRSTTTVVWLPVGDVPVGQGILRVFGIRLVGIGWGIQPWNIPTKPIVVGGRAEMSRLLTGFLRELVVPRRVAPDASHDGFHKGCGILHPWGRAATRDPFGAWSFRGEAFRVAELLMRLPQS